MKITKYLLLLILIVSFTSVIFIATQPGDFKITHSERINLDINKVYNYINEPITWKEWIAIPFSEKIIEGQNILILDGKSNKNKFKWVKSKLEKSIYQNYFLDEIPFKSNWIFKKKNNETFISWEIKGSLNFEWKIKALIEGGKQAMFDNQIKSSLKNIKRNLLEDHYFYKIELIGQTDLEYNHSISTDTIVKNTDTDVALKINAEKLLSTSNELGLTKTDKTLHKISKLENNNIEVKSYLPINEEVLTNKGNPIKGERFENLSCYKLIYNGNHDNKQKALIKANKKIDSLNLQLAFKQVYFERQLINSSQTLKRKEWVTEIYIPLKKKKVYKAPVIKTINEEVKEEVLPVLEIAPVAIPKPSIPDVSIQ